MKKCYVNIGLWGLLSIAFWFGSCNRPAKLNNESGLDSTVFVENVVWKTIKERRSVRKFLRQEVTDETIGFLVEAGQWAPSNSNSQTWQFIAVRDTVKRMVFAKKIYDVFTNGGERKDLSFQDFRLYTGVDAPVQLFVFNDAREKNKDDIAENAIGCYMACQNILLAAKSVGLGTCLQTFPLFAKPEINDLLEVPEGVEFVASIAIGYPDEEPRSAPRKKKLQEILHFEKW